MRGECAFVDNDCCFRHPKADHIQSDSLPKILTEFKCGIWWQKIYQKEGSYGTQEKRTLQLYFRVYRKRKWFLQISSRDCWYKHEKGISKDENLLEVSGIKNSDLVKSLFDMMEAFADRMALLENSAQRMTT